MVANKVEVTVTRLKTRLMKITHPDGYQLVVGGRLLLDARNGRKTPHPDLPEYTPEMFPTSFQAWSDGRRERVKVAIISDTGKEREVGVVRACTLLFAPQPKPAVEAWLRSKQ